MGTHNMTCTECKNDVKELYGPYIRKDMKLGEIEIIKKDEKLCIKCSVKREGFRFLVDPVTKKPKGF